LHRESETCLAEALRKNAFSRALRTPIATSLVERLGPKPAAGATEG
jgi:predicted RNA-binding protein YlxR (DUF448 family)